MHLRLRRPTSADALILRDLWRNEQVRQFLGGVISEDVIEGKIASLHEHWDKYGFGQWSICEKETGQIIGLCGLQHSEEGIEISYMFVPASWGRGRATEATSASLNHGFRRLGIERIVAITQKANRSSCRLLEKIGMHHTNTLWRYNATQYVYQFTQTEWLAHLATYIVGSTLAVDLPQTRDCKYHRPPGISVHSRGDALCSPFDPRGRPGTP